MHFKQIQSHQSEPSKVILPMGILVEFTNLRIYEFTNFEQRARRKQSIPSKTHKLLNKAKANFEAVEKGTFGLSN